VPPYSTAMTGFSRDIVTTLLVVFMETTTPSVPDMKFVKLELVHAAHPTCPRLFKLVMTSPGVDTEVGMTRFAVVIDCTDIDEDHCGNEADPPDTRTVPAVPIHIF